MYKKLLLPPILLLLGYALLTQSDFKTIASGVAIFLVGMFFMEDGFKVLSGGALEKVLKKVPVMSLHLSLVVFFQQLLFRVPLS